MILNRVDSQIINYFIRVFQVVQLWRWHYCVSTLHCLKLLALLSLIIKIYRELILYLKPLLSFLDGILFNSLLACLLKLIDHLLALGDQYLYLPL